MARPLKDEDKGEAKEKRAREAGEETYRKQAREAGKEAKNKGVKKNAEGSEQGLRQPALGSRGKA